MRFSHRTSAEPALSDSPDREGGSPTQTEKATLLWQRGLYLCRQRPQFTLSAVEGLPHTFACTGAPIAPGFGVMGWRVPSALRGLTCGVRAAFEPRAAILSERSESKDLLKRFAGVSEAGVRSRYPERSEGSAL